MIVPGEHCAASMNRSPRPRRLSPVTPRSRGNRFIKLTGATKTVNRELEAKNRALAGWKGYTTNLTGQSAEFVIDAYHQLWLIEKSFRMSKHDLQARPIYHHIRESIEAHLSIVVTAMAVSHRIETQTGWSIKKFARTARRYRTVRIRVGGQTLARLPQFVGTFGGRAERLCW